MQPFGLEMIMRRFAAEERRLSVTRLNFAMTAGQSDSDRQAPLESATAGAHRTFFTSPFLKSGLECFTHNSFASEPFIISSCSHLSNVSKLTFHSVISHMAAIQIQWATRRFLIQPQSVVFIADFRDGSRPRTPFQSQSRSIMASCF